MKMHRRVGVTILLLFLSVATVVVLSPNGNVETRAIAVQSDGTSAPGTAGLRAYLDPETGELTAGLAPQSEMEFDADLQNALRRDDEGLEVRHHANGMVSMDLQGRYQSVSVVHVDENGKRFVCTHDAAEVERALTEPISQPATTEVK